MWNASRFCVSSLRRGHANLLCIVPTLIYVQPKLVPFHFKFNCRDSIFNNVFLFRGHAKFFVLVPFLKFEIIYLNLYMINLYMNIITCEIYIYTILFTYLLGNCNILRLLTYLCCSTNIHTYYSIL